MAINTSISIAIKEFSGCYTLETFSIFRVNEINKSFASLRVRVYNKTVFFKFKCSLCGKYHDYKYSINELMKREIIVGGCEVLGLPLFYIGNYSKIKQIVNRQNNRNKQIYAML